MLNIMLKSKRLAIANHALYSYYVKNLAGKIRAYLIMINFYPICYAAVLFNINIILKSKNPAQFIIIVIFKSV